MSADELSEPSPEVKELIREWVKLNKKKYGPKWKEILAQEMTEQSMPLINELLNLKKENLK